ncbi:fucose 4-O-acetylase-like acetyltransferase [Haloactinopolyspora alba]|uniref:Fucose 4-O-acetylase-like acetyltransferase n=1 Tax=Haloactinopolyspora alba TaxID=648780 RepID=A0A2P8E2V8_9ACTN|nr:acyltransferase [Haloactinopolyspora alba]PSL03737.1 fucose 4-O-acetylase-like acetyltransferase [Haloactinopolyspora alba]
MNAGRDRFVDALRAASLVAVAVGHWLMATMVVVDGEVHGANALDSIAALRPATWLLQVMPLFFMAGGFSNALVWRRTVRRGGGYTEFVRSRVHRLTRPAMAFAVITPTVLGLALLTGLPEQQVGLVGELLGGPLWFLGVYVLVTALAPLMLRWHGRSPVAAAVALAVAAATVDVVRMEVAGGVGYLNFAFVWLFAQQVGFWYVDGRLARVTRKVAWIVLAAACVALLVLTGLGPYPVSMVGLTGEMSNMAPPSVCLLVLALAQAAACVLARPRVNAWLERTRPWAAVVACGSRAMTIYLWHLPVLVAAFAMMLAAGVTPPAPGSTTWWLSRPVWVVALAAMLAAVSMPLARWERAVPARGGSPGGVAVACLGVALVSLGLFGLTLGGLADPETTWPSVAGVLAGRVLVGTVGAACGYPSQGDGSARDRVS